MATIKDNTTYDISVKGAVTNLRTGRKLKHSLNQKGYCQLQLSKDGFSKTISIHRCVWEAYNGAIPKGLEVNHIDGVKANNDLSNLELVTRVENVRKAVETGLIKSGADCEKSVGVDQINVLTKKVIASFGSIRLATKETKVAGSSISNVCSGKRTTAGGFLWAYSNK